MSSPTRPCQAQTLVVGERSQAEEVLRDVPLLLADMPGGVHIGTFIHRVLETADFTASELGDELLGRIKAELRWRPIDLAHCPRGRGRP